MTSQWSGSIRRPLVCRIALTQLALLAPITIGISFFSTDMALAILAGASIELIGRTYFGYHAFRYIGAQQISLVVGAFKRGELGKFVLVVVLFGLLFILKPGVQPIAVFVGYLVSWFLGTCLSFRMVK